MRHVSKLPAEGINVSKTHPLVDAGALVVGLSLIFALVVVVLIFLVELSLYFISVEREADMFENWLPDDLVTVSPNDERLYELQALVDRLAVHWPDSAYEFRVEIDDSDASNAVALPGGLIIITDGLLQEVESENELAFVIAHELGHFKNRDHLRALGRGAVLSVFIAAISDGDAGNIGVNVADLTLRGFGRGQESDADTFALSLVALEYGHVNEAWRLFERWNERAPSTAEIAVYLSTHPDTGERVENLKAMALQQGWETEGELRPLFAD